MQIISILGNVFGLRIGPAPTVVISDFHTCVEVFKDANFCARPEYLTEVMGTVMHQAQDHPSPNRGVVFSSGHNWDSQRKFLLGKLSQHGLGRARLEHAVQEQVELLAKTLRSKAAVGPVALGEMFSISLVNAIWSIVTGDQFELDDPLVSSIYSGIDYFIESHRLIGVLMVFPWLRHFVSYLGSAVETMKTRVRDMMKAIVDDHIKTFNDGHERDLVDAFIGKIKHTEDPKSPFFGRRGRTNLEQNMLELFGAGANPVATTLSFCFLYLGRQPELQERIAQEILDNCGSGPVDLASQQRLPFTNAFIHEVLRITAINFIGTPHRNLAAATVAGHQIPAGTTVFAFLWYILNDPEYWEAPREFRPERFLDPESGDFVKDERLIPFLVGRRQCPGLHLAQTEIFLFLTNLLRQFRVSESSAAPLPAPTPTMGFVMGCPKYEILLTER